MSDTSPIPEVEVSDLAQRRGEVWLLDVRQPDEYEEAHVPGATLIPLDQLPGRTAEVPADVEVYVICRSGGRSAKAVEILNAAGHRPTNVAGGTLAWIEAGHPVATGADAG
jgi:rhodanese-related sulfurtransferase